MGLLVGLLVGLSVAEVVGAVVAALTALLAAFFGLRSDGEAPSGATGVASAWRLAGFGLAASLALLVGIHLRVTNALGPTPADLVGSFAAAGYEESQALQLAAYRQLGLSPEGWQTTNENRVAASGMGVLFGAEGSSECSTVAAERFDEPAERANAFALAGPPWRSVVEALEGLEAHRQTLVMDAVWDAICDR